LPYELIVDGQTKPLDDARYLLSPGDLYTLPQVPQIMAAGVSALKIEGRYKDVDYVALTTRAYREAVDQAWAGRPVEVSAEKALQLEQVYSRGLGPFFLTGTNHQAVVEGRAPRHRGVRIASVVRVGEEHLVVAPSEAHRIAPLKPGDGLVFDAADWRSPQEREEGGRVYEVRTLRDGRLELRFGNGAVDFSRIQVGDVVWRTNDPALDKLVSEFVAPPAPVQRQLVDIAIEASVGQPLRTRWTLASKPEVSVTVATPAPLGEAERSVLTEAQLREQFGRLGPTPYQLGQVTVQLSGRPFVPVSALNQLRREAVELLQARQAMPPAAPPEVDLADPRLMSQLRPARVMPPAPPVVTPRLHLLVRTPEQLNAALSAQPDSITLDYLDLYGLWPSLERVKASGIAVRVASPRVLKPGEEKIGEFLLRLDCPLLIRAAGLLDAMRERAAHALTGDFSLNAANTLSAQALLDLGLTRLTPAYDLNAAQVTALAKAVGASRVEAVAYQHLPVFHTEHCVFCRFLSSGTSYKDCGRPCEHHRVAVQDPTGRVHPVMADVGCRNTVFGAEAQQAAAYLDQWRQAGIVDFRLEFVHETEAQVTAVTAAFRAALAGRSSAAQLAQALREIAPEGVTEGSYFVPKDYLTLPILQ
jgi:putative protease